MIYQTIRGHELTFTPIRNNNEYRSYDNKHNDFTQTFILKYDDTIWKHSMA